MSYCLHVYAIDLEKLKSYCGSKNETILKHGEVKLGSLMTHHDDFFTASMPPGTPSVRMALKQLINGEPRHPSYGFQYGYALKLLCELYGSPLNNNGWSATRDSYLEKMQEILKSYGLDSYLRRLLYRGAPVEIPVIQDFPAIGYLQLADAVAIDQAMKPVDFSNYDEDIAESLDNFHSWAITAKKVEGGLISFYH